LLFLGALFWAKEQDPFSREWFTLKTADHGSVKCVAVLPKPIRQYPVIIFAHGVGEDLLKDGTELRQMAELGLAVVSLEYSKTNQGMFRAQFEALLRYLIRQKWADTNAIAWVGYSQGAIDTLDFALSHPKQQPQLLVQLDGAGAEPSTFNFQLLTNLHCPALFVHGEQDEVFPVENTERLASMLQTNGLPVELKIIPGISHDLQPNRGVVFRNIGEYCLTHLAGKSAWENYHSIAQWQSEAPALWLLLLPAAAWIAGWLAWLWYCRVASPEKIKLQRHQIVLRWIAVLLATWALVTTTIHLITPYFSVNDRTLAVARKYLVQPKERADFEYLAAQPIWHGQKLKTMLEQVELADYNRELINWQLDDKIYRDYVLSPDIEPSSLSHQL
jgi:predicted esterase